MLATGAFLLTDHTDEVLGYFTPGREIETFVSPEEPKSKVDYYLAHLQVRGRIARAGLERTGRLPTYAECMRQLLERISWCA